MYSTSQSNAHFHTKKGMFQQVYQNGIISLLYSLGNKPLQLWMKKEVKDKENIRRVLDEEIQSSVIEIDSENLVNTWIYCPAIDTTCQELGITLRYLIFYMKPIENKECSIEIQVRSVQNEKIYLRFSTYQENITFTKSPVQLICVPMKLECGWNFLPLDLYELMNRYAHATFASLSSIQLHASCRIRRICCMSELTAESNMPAEFRLYKRLSASQVHRLKKTD